ncbi:helix-turn-helix domain-containing protein [Acinetobacter sp. ASP199]|uniref:helix-turn-helix domain-containing protein n=2 Tax=unclassified Acinetobacter TaxID=196816 RepID=UPI001F61DBF6|nr:helix-turn-helix domain-containing protein [Acinetobacter sp. ASP199]UNT60452.1 hypothetical protein IHE35_06530 [Acinetobacter sp. ASP199]
MNTAQVIPFKKPSQPAQGAGKNMYSDKFDQGYVMSSRLYRKEVWPFLSDAARNVYAELENRINGHNKESDFVSYSQLQGGDLPGARQLSRRTVSTGLKELIKLGVITVLADGKQGMKSYRLNEISLKDRFTNETSLPSTPVHLGNQTGSPSTPVTSVPSKHTIDTPIESLENNKNKAPAEFVPQDRGALNFIDYHSEDSKLYSLKDLSGTYPIKQDFMAQAAVSFPKLSQDIVLEQLKELAQWSVGQPERISQKWMTTWLNWLRNYQPAKPKTEAKQPKAEQPKRHRYGQGVIPRGES